MGDTSMSNNPGDNGGDHNALSPGRLLAALATVAVILGGVTCAWRTKSSSSECGGQGELSRRRVITMLADGSRSMGIHGAVAQDAAREVVRCLSPGDGFAMYQVRGVFDDEASRIVEVADVPLTRAEITADTLPDDLSPSCRNELREQWSVISTKRPEWLRQTQLKGKIQGECSGYLSALEGLGLRGKTDPNVQHRILIIIGDLEAEEIRAGRCSRVRPDPAQAARLRPFEGVHVMLAVPRRDGPNGRFWRDNGDLWRRYFRAGGALDVTALSLQEFRAGGVERLLRASAPPRPDGRVLAVKP